MKKSTFMFILTLITFFQIDANTQERGKDIPLSPEHKRAIISLLRTADSRFYKFQSGDRREVYGSRRMSTAELSRIKELGAPDTRGIIVEYKETRSILIHWKDGTILAATSPTGKTDPDVFVNLLGKQGADKLRDILSKYFVHDQEN